MKSKKKVSACSEVKEHLKGDIREQKHGIHEDKELMSKIKAVKKFKMKKK